jgi:hypothetical protein
MENYSECHRTIFVISIWAEMIPGKKPTWRGSLRTIDGQRMNYSTLTELNRLLCELSGWHNAQMDSMEDLPRE